MNKITLTFILLLALFACQKEKTDEKKAYSFSAEMDAATKAHADDGNGDYVNRCIMEIYYGNNLCGRYVSATNEKKANFNVQLVTNRTYKIVFWADCSTNLSDLYYETTSLTNISFITPYHGSNDRMDAFCYTGNFATISSSIPYAVKLTRAFAQVNISNSSYTGGNTEITFSAPCSYNALTNELGTQAQFQYTQTGLYNTTPQVVTMDYIFAGSTKTGINITVNGKQLTNIPIQRNIRTNISM